MPDHPNPQGKGQVPILELWSSSRPGALARKDAPTLLSDYVVSLLVLSAEFSFKPVVGRHYHLYRSGGRWRLSLIAPWEWTSTDPGICVGTCYLRTDMTWKLFPADDLLRHPDLANDLADFVRDFLLALESQDTLEAGLPYYVRGLPFYQRLLATGLASSISQTANISGLAGRNARFWLAHVGANGVSLLPAGQPGSH
jgi:hypothetical protein